MKDSETISDYFSLVQYVVNQLRVNGEKLEDVRVIKKIIRSLTNCFDYVVTVIEEGRDLSTITIEGLLGSLCFHEHRMNHRAAAPVEKAFQSKVNLSGTSSCSGDKTSSQGKDVSYKNHASTEKNNLGQQAL